MPTLAPSPLCPPRRIRGGKERFFLTGLFSSPESLSRPVSSIQTRPKSRAIIEATEHNCRVFRRRATVLVFRAVALQWHRVPSNRVWGSVGKRSLFGHILDPTLSRAPDGCVAPGASASPLGAGAKGPRKSAGDPACRVIGVNKAAELRTDRFFLCRRRERKQPFADAWKAARDAAALSCFLMF